MSSSKTRYQTVLRLYALALALPVAACGQAPRVQTPPQISADDALAAASLVVDCEWAAADKFDNGVTPISILAQRVMGVCTPQRLQARKAAGISPIDTSLEAEELNQAIRNVEAARHRRKQAS